MRAKYLSLESNWPGTQLMGDPNKVKYKEKYSPLPYSWGVLEAASQYHLLQQPHTMTDSSRPHLSSQG